jgi:hypothetical protein
MNMKGEWLGGNQQNEEGWKERVMGGWRWSKYFI